MQEPAQEEPSKRQVPPDIYAELNEVQSKLLKLIEESPLLVDELVDKTGLPYAQTVEALTELEILGHIQLEPNGKYSLTLITLNAKAAVINSRSIILHLSCRNLLNRYSVLRYSHD